MAAGHGAPVAESDDALVRRARTGDERAFEQLYERFFKRIYLFVDKRLRNTADTEETVQEIFINVFNSMDGYRGDAPFAAWVFGVTRRTIAGRFKRKRHLTVPLGEDEHDRAAVGAFAQASPLELYECEELLAQIEEKLACRITDEQRELFRLHHLEELPISEIARTLQKSENAVKSNLYRTRKLLLAR